MWGQFDPENRDSLERAGFGTIEDVLHFFLNHREAILKHFDKLDFRADEIDDFWQDMCFRVFCGGRFCGKGCEYAKKVVEPINHGEPQDDEWTEGNPDSFSLDGRDKKHYLD